MTGKIYDPEGFEIENATLTPWITDRYPTQDRTYLCTVRRSPHMTGLQLVAYDPRYEGQRGWCTKREVIAWTWIPDVYRGEEE